MMRKLVLVLLLVTAFSSNAQYIDINYEGADIEKVSDHWLYSRLVDEKKNVLVLISVYDSRNDEIIMPTKQFDRYYVVGNTLQRESKRNIPIIQSHYTNSLKDIYLKIELVAIDSKSVGTFAKGIIEIAGLFRPETAATASAISESFFALVKSNSNIYIDHEERFEDLNDPNGKTITFSFNKNGDVITNTTTSSAKNGSEHVHINISTTESINLTGITDWKKLPMKTSKADVFYTSLKDMPNSEARQKKCYQFREYLNSKYGTAIADNIIAIAANTMEWGQDDTAYPCISLDSAYKYYEKGFKSIVGCKTDACRRTKEALLYWQNSNFHMANKKFGVDIQNVSKCDIENLTNTKIEKWNSFTFVKEEDKAFTVKTSMYLNGKLVTIKHNFNWGNNSLEHHSCST